MTRLAVLLAVRRLRRDRQALLAVGVILVTLVLYVAGAASHAARAQADRLDQRYTADNASSWKVAPVVAAGERELTVVAVPAVDPAVQPMFPGTSVTPGPGQMLVSPALSHAQAGGDEAGLLSARLPWQVVGLVGPAGLSGPQELLAVVGLDATAYGAAVGIDAGGAPPAPVSGLTLGVLATLVLTPGFLLLIACARVDTRRRERRLATLSLVGSSRRQLRRVVLVDAVALSVPACLVGLVLSWALVPLLARTPLGQRFPVAELRPDAWWLAAIPVVAGVLVTCATVLATRRISTEPLKTQRSAETTRPSALRLVPVMAGVAGFLGATALASRLSELALGAVELASLILVFVGLPLAGPVLVRAVAGLTTRREGLPGASLVGARRLQRDPAAGTRAVTGLVLATFMFGFVSALDLAVPSRGLPPADVYIEPGGQPAQALIADVARLPGVRAVAPIRYVQANGTRVLLSTCVGAQQFLGVIAVQGQCREGAVLRRDGSGEDAAGPAVTVPLEGRTGDTTWPVSGTFTGLTEDPMVSTLLALPLDTLAAQPQNDVRVQTDGSRDAALSVIAAAARASPLATAGPSDVVLVNKPQAAAVGQVLALVLAAACMFALIGIAISLGESLLDRAPVLALLGAVGIGRKGARQMSAIEVGIPLAVLTLPSLVLGFTLAYGGGRLLGGDVQVPWSALMTASGAVTVLAGFTFAAAVRVTTAIPTSAVLREDAV